MMVVMIAVSVSVLMAAAFILKLEEAHLCKRSHLELPNPCTSSVLIALHRNLMLWMCYIVFIESGHYASMPLHYAILQKAH